MKEMIAHLERQEQLKKKLNIKNPNLSEDEMKDVDDILYKAMAGRLPTEKEREETRKFDQKIGYDENSFQRLKGFTNFKLEQCNSCGNDQGVSLKCSRCKAQERQRNGLLRSTTNI
eukprot:TRINITY_DN7389_c0_g1_i2.p2 TRINITY_DN7389_c0_g1~~TRINITY_DN7389_c0_g1_i2.p2  ORF type:complete len:116 (+),score=36.18 TRINITY_DN7389_c0_g1_i2:122-469(+)